MNHPNKHPFRLLGLITLLAGLLIGPSSIVELAGRASAQVPGPSSTVTGFLITSRFKHSATRLLNGKVLVVGGVFSNLQQSRFLDSAELYDPTSGTWSSAGNLSKTRLNHTATVLSDGKVLVTGGSDRNVILRSAEVYDPETGRWSETGSLNMARDAHTATLLPNGKVLVAGGFDGDFTMHSAEVYDPKTSSWSETSSLSAPRNGHTATLLLDGKVLVAGGGEGSARSSAELFDPITGKWSSTSSLIGPHSGHTATLLANGRVLVASCCSVEPAELYDPLAATWSVTANGQFSDPVAVTSPTASLLSDGNVLIVSGAFDYDGGFPTITHLYDTISGIWSYGGALISGRVFHTATALANGRVLVAGGRNYEFTSYIAELYGSGLPEIGTVSSVSAGSFNPTGLSSEAIAVAFGTGLATITTGAATIPLPTSLGGTTVKVKDAAGNERLAPLFFVSPNQINYQIPFGTVSGLASVIITSGDGAISKGVAQINRVAPSLFAANADGRGVAAGFALRVKGDGSRSYDPIAQFDAAQNRYVTRSLDLGTTGDQVYLVLFGTGIRHRNSHSSVIATIGGVYAEVSFAGPQGDYVGLDQLNVLVPRSLAGRGEVDVLLTVEAQIANPVRIQIN